MKKIATFLIAFLLVGYVIIQYVTPQAFSYTNQPPMGKTGSPGDGGMTCNSVGCHAGNATQSATGWITSNIPGTGYLAGNTYTITATATKTGISKFGFEVSPQNPSGTKLGTLINTSSQTAIINTNYIGQTFSGTSGSNTKSWSFDWKAPVTGSGAVTFYGSFNCANGDGSTPGDFIYTSTLTVSESTVGINAYQQIKGLEVYPSPSTGIFTLKFLNTPVFKIEVFNLNGKIVKEFNLNNLNANSFTFDLSNQKTGIYLMKITSNNKVGLQKIVIAK